MYEFALDPEYYGEPEDYVHRDEIKCYDDAKEWIEEIIKCVYDTGDVESMENALDELAAIWKITLPSQDPLIEKKGEQQSKWFELGKALVRSQARVTQKQGV